MVYNSHKKYLIPAGDLRLPTPPNNHKWAISNVIETVGLKTEYSIEARLLNEDDTVVVTVAETWNPAVETIADFAVSIASVLTVHMDTYLQFMSINWTNDNKSLTRQPVTTLGDNKMVQTWE